VIIRAESADFLFFSTSQHPLVSHDCRRYHVEISTDSKISKSSSDDSSLDTIDQEDFYDEAKDSSISPATDTQSIIINEKCRFDGDNPCTLDSPDRKVVSNYFGRNKKETLAIPDDMWPKFCRRHYQRARYRQSEMVFVRTQMDLVRQTIQNMRSWGGIDHFAITLRKQALDQLNDLKMYASVRANAIALGQPIPTPPPSCKEEWLEPYLGEHKSFDQVLAFVDMVSGEAGNHAGGSFAFEILPRYKPGFMNRKKPAKERETAARPVGTKRAYRSSPSASTASGSSSPDMGAWSRKAGKGTSRRRV
jgi:hypothetical protein